MTIHRTVLAPTTKPVEAPLVDVDNELTKLLVQQRETEEELVTLEKEIQSLKESALRYAKRELKSAGRAEHGTVHTPQGERTLTLSTIVRRCYLARAVTDPHTSHLALTLARATPKSTMEVLDQVVIGIESRKMRLLELEQRILDHRPRSLSGIKGLLEYVASALLAGDVEHDIFAWMISDCAEAISEIESNFKESPQRC